MTSEELEFRISQYLDGTLGEPERRELEALLAESDEARKLLESYRALDAAIKAHMPMPALAWDKLRAQVRSRTDELPIAGKSRLRRAIWLGPAILAAAACLLVGIGIIRFEHVASPAAPIGIAQVVGPRVASRADAVALVELGTPPQSASALQEFPYAQGAVVLQPRLTIAGIVGSQDDSLPEQ